MRIAVSLLLAALLPACALMDGRLTGAGSAIYTYKRTLADGSTCEVTTQSARDVNGGALVIDSQCALTAKADSTQGVVEAIKLADDLAKMVSGAIK